MKFFTTVNTEGVVDLAQLDQRSCGCPIPRSVQSRVGWGQSKEGVPAYSRGVGLDDLQKSSPTQTIL